jgi:hypothetical protein
MMDSQARSLVQPVLLRRCCRPCDRHATVLRQHLAETTPRISRANATAATAAAFKLRNSLRGLVLHELAHVVADHAHTDFLIQDFAALQAARRFAPS